ncbi:hypothetical protein SO802_010192 [Lithocarpus litseifolius]|uniref:DUF8040 domain-containing protein n=1 Tax=Lithocarpus litseifolius TaxID=425828 RepID=A0AAW2DHF2_9ROSI
MEEPTTKGKKVAKKVDRASQMTMALQEYTALARERFSNNKKGKSSGSSEHVAQSAGSGDPCSLRIALEVLNQYEDLDDDTYVNIAKALQKKEKRVLFMGMPEHKRRRWMERHAYFNSDDDDMDIGGCDDDMDTSFSDNDMDISDCDDDMITDADTDSEYDSEKEEFWFVFPLIGKMVAYFQLHYDKRPQRTSILGGSDYMAKVRDGNPTNCHDMFRMSLDLFYHLVDELKHYGYLKEGKGRVDVQKAVAIFLYLVSRNTRMQLVANRFQHSIETMDRKFRRVLRAVHTYGQHLIKPDPNVVGLPEHLRGNKYDPWTCSLRMSMMVEREAPMTLGCLKKLLKTQSMASYGHRKLGCCTGVAAAALCCSLGGTSAAPVNPNSNLLPRV